MIRRFLPLLCLMTIAGCSDQRFSNNLDGPGSDGDDPGDVVPDSSGRGSVTIQLCSEDDSRVPLEGIQVLLDHDWGTMEERTNAEGLATLVSVPEGVWTLSATRGGESYITEVEVFSDEDTYLEVDDCLDDMPIVVLAHTSSTLYEVDVNHGDSVPRGKFTFGGIAVRDISDLAVEADAGQAYAVGMSGKLYQLDTADASLTAVCDVPSNANALAWSGHGRLIVGAQKDLWMIDPRSCELTLVANAGSAKSDGDIAPAGVAQVYWAVSGGKVLLVDLRTGATTQAFAHRQQVYGLSWVHGELLGFTPGGGVWALSSSAGSEVLRFDTPHAWWGAAAGPIAK
jgi:hypothetical protein